MYIKDLLNKKDITIDIRQKPEYIHLLKETNDIFWDGYWKLSELYDDLYNYKYLEFMLLQGTASPNYIIFFDFDKENLEISPETRIKYNLKVNI